MRNLVLAWLASSAAFAVAFLGWMVPWATPEGVHILYWSDYLRLFLMMLGAALAFQLVYDGLVYVILGRSGLWSIWTVAFAYLLPVFIIDRYGIDTPREARAMIAWLGFACLIAGVSWFFARREVRRTADIP
ncbi:hypothetical protein CK489_29260 [Bradyrhizobium sp. UFLA03-84]|uniref:hypothetical protein n=1 Tax=Bradyrhizobium sp. UFLA03-84 TaxID=418599 RepID=UPI000BAE047A|nr:hypothetical protein [Bradyrhizobium sp. UFLA03-84]PAY05470.1 hypothetical protein CK489_29260 [Bradyrhizobium sp. UFLA03-84]